MYARRIRIELLAENQSAGFEVAQGFRQHEICDAENFALEFAVMERAVFRQMPQDWDFPFLPDNFQRENHRAGVLQIRRQPVKNQVGGSVSEYKNRLQIVKETPGYWRVIITNGELNMFDPWMFAELNALMTNIERDEDLKVVVFESGNADFL